MPGCNQDLSFGYIGVHFLKGDQQNSNHAIQVTLPAENRLFSSFKQKYISFEIFSPQLLLTKTKTKKQRLPSSESDLSSSDTLSSSGGRRSSLNNNASTLNFFFTWICEAARRVLCFWSLDPLDPLVHGRVDVRRWATRLQPRHYDRSKNSSPNSNDQTETLQPPKLLNELT